MVISYGRCFQKFTVQFQINECDENTGGVSFDNEYLMWLTSLPKNQSSNSDISDWLHTIGATFPNETIPIFFDLLNFEYIQSCESFSVSFDFNSNITFYDDDSFNAWSLISSHNPLFVTNSYDQRLYVEIKLEGADELTQAGIA